MRSPSKPCFLRSRTPIFGWSSVGGKTLFSLTLFDFLPPRIGEEKVTVLQMMRKMIAYQFEDEPLQIR